MARRSGKPDIRERFGDAIRISREALGLTQEELAHKAKMHRSYLSDIERGSRNVSIINIERLAAGLSISLADLFAQVK
ncbi:MAG: helix-turn-helix domain-containing protein [Gemmataceae bacterium]